MVPDNLDNSNNDFFFKKNLEDMSKDEIIDESFRRADSVKKENAYNKKIRKKPFYKSGFLIIIISVLCIAIVNLSPWAYVKCNKEDTDGFVDKLIFINNDKEDIGNDTNSQLIASIFESDNCSNTSCNYLGLDFNDFSNTPQITFYGFLIIMLIGLIFVIIQIIDKMHNISVEIFTIIHSVLSAITMIISIYLFILMMELISLYFLLYFNSEFLTAKNIVFVSPAAIFLILVLFNVITWEFIIIVINYREFERKISSKPTEKPFFTYKSGVEYNER